MPKMSEFLYRFFIKGFNRIVYEMPRRLSDSFLNIGRKMQN